MFKGRTGGGGAARRKVEKVAIQEQRKVVRLDSVNSRRIDLDDGADNKENHSKMSRKELLALYVERKQLSKANEIKKKPIFKPGGVYKDANPIKPSSSTCTRREARSGKESTRSQNTKRGVETRSAAVKNKLSSSARRKSFAPENFKFEFRLNPPTPGNDENEDDEEYFDIDDSPLLDDNSTSSNEDLPSLDSAYAAYLGTSSSNGKTVPLKPLLLSASASCRSEVQSPFHDSTNLPAKSRVKFEAGTLTPSNSSGEKTPHPKRRKFDFRSRSKK